MSVESIPPTGAVTTPNVHHPTVVTKQQWLNYQICLTQCPEGYQAYQDFEALEPDLQAPGAYVSKKTPEKV